MLTINYMFKCVRTSQFDRLVLTVRLDASTGTRCAIIMQEEYHQPIHMQRDEKKTEIGVFSRC